MTEDKGPLVTWLTQPRKLLNLLQNTLDLVIVLSDDEDLSPVKADIASSIVAEHVDENGTFEK